MKIRKLSAEFISILLFLLSVGFLWELQSGQLSELEAWVWGILIMVQAFLMIGILLLKARRRREEISDLIDFVYAEFSLERSKTEGTNQQVVLRGLLQQLRHNISLSKQTLADMAEGKKVDNQSLLDSIDPLLNTIGKMNAHLAGVASEEGQRKYFAETIAALNDVLSGTYAEQDGGATYFSFLKTLANRLQMCQGALFVVVKDEETEEEYLELAETFAWERKKYLSKRLGLADGLVGQCLMEQEVIYLEHLPEDYIQIKSGMGETVPQSLMLVPVINQEKVYAVIEMASLQAVHPPYIELAKAAAERLGTSLASLQMAAKTKFLLEKSQKANRDMQETEEMMRSNMEELFKMQEEMNNKIKLLEEQGNYTQQLFHVIDVNNAFIEYDITGKVVDMSKHFREVMGYKDEDKEWLRFQDMVALEATSEQTPEAFWENICEGQQVFDENIAFKARQGQLYASYSAFSIIKNKRGQSEKVIHLLNFRQQEQLANLNQANLLKVINHNLPLIELDTQGTVLSANREFMNRLLYQETEIINSNIFDNLFKNCETDILGRLWKQANMHYDASVQLDLQNGEGGLQNYRLIVYLPKGNDLSNERLMLILIPSEEVIRTRPDVI